MNNNNISKKKAQKVLAERDPYVGIVLEDINDKLKTVIDGQAMSDKRIDRLHGAVSLLDGKVEKIDTRLTSVEIDMKSVKENLEKINAREGFHEKKISALDNRVTKLERAPAI